MWVDSPPPDTRGARDADVDHAALAAALRSNPGRWALLIGLSGAATVRDGAQYRPRGSYEAVVRQGHVYARYVGEGVPTRG